MTFVIPCESGLVNLKIKKAADTPDGFPLRDGYGCNIYLLFTF